MAMSTTATPKDVFISLRFFEALPAALALREALQRMGISCFVCEVPPGDDIGHTVVEQLNSCKMAVILGTRTYGKKTDCNFSTYEELLFIRNDEKPYFLIKMCDEFAEAHARFYLPKNIAFYRWAPDMDTRIVVPDELLAQIAAKFHSVTNPSSSPKPSPRPPVKPRPLLGSHTPASSSVHPPTEAPREPSPLGPQPPPAPPPPPRQRPPQPPPPPPPPPQQRPPQPAPQRQPVLAPQQPPPTLRRPAAESICDGDKCTCAKVQCERCKQLVLSCAVQEDHLLVCPISRKRCPVPSCSWFGTDWALPAHMENCSKYWVYCIRCNSDYLRSEIHQHLKKHNQDKVTVPKCPVCAISADLAVNKDHGARDCPDWLMRCWECGADVLRRNREGHARICKGINGITQSMFATAESYVAQHDASRLRFKTALPFKKGDNIAMVMGPNDAGLGWAINRRTGARGLVSCLNLSRVKPKPRFQPRGLRWKAIMDFEAGEPGELSFLTHDQFIDVEPVGTDGWAKATALRRYSQTNTGGRGLVPLNFITETDEQVGSNLDHYR